MRITDIAKFMGASITLILGVSCKTSERDGQTLVLDAAQEACTFGYDTGDFWSRGTIVKGQTTFFSFKLKFDLPLRFVFWKDQESANSFGQLYNYIKDRSSQNDIIGKVVEGTPRIVRSQAEKGLRNNKGIFSNQLIDPKDSGCGLVITAKQTFPVEGSEKTKIYQGGVPLFVNPNVTHEKILSDVAAWKEKNGANLTFVISSDRVNGSVQVESNINSDLAYYKFTYHLSKDGSSIPIHEYKNYGLCKSVRIDVDHARKKVTQIIFEQKPNDNADNVVEVVYRPSEH